MESNACSMIVLGNELTALSVVLHHICTFSLKPAFVSRKGGKHLQVIVQFFHSILYLKKMKPLNSS